MHLIFGTIYAQNTVSDLQNFVKNADMNCYLTKIQKNILDCHKAQCEYFKVPTTTNPPKVELLKGKTVAMLVVQFINMENYDLSKNIYDHITIDSTRVFTLACVDDNLNVLAFANYFDGTYAYSEVKAERPENVERLEQVIKNINTQEPETILFCHSLKNYHDLNNFMFIKDGKIFVYRVIEGDVFELNEYIKQSFQEEKIRNLSNTNVPFIYQYYDKTKPVRKTSETPDKYKMICSSVRK